MLDEPPGHPGSIVGREAQLARLAAFVDDVPTRGQVLVVHGDAGMGKSTLLASAAESDAGASLLLLFLQPTVDAKSSADAAIPEIRGNSLVNI